MGERESRSQKQASILAAHSCNIVCNGLNDKSTYGINDMFKYIHDTHEVNTRSSSNSFAALPKYRLAKTLGNLYHRGAKYFNKLPQHMKKCKVSCNIQKECQVSVYLQDHGTIDKMCPTILLCRVR